MKFLLKTIFRLLVTVTIILAIGAGYLYWSATQPVISGNLPAKITVYPGDHVYAVAERIKAQRIDLPGITFMLWARITGKASQLKAGTYLMENDMTVQMLLNMLVEGKSVLSKVAIVEGWTFEKMRKAIDEHPDLVHETKDWSHAELLKAIGANQHHPEGLFFPDTYYFSPQTKDLDIYKQAYNIMQKKLDAAWSARDPRVPYQNIYDALIMASLVEKETGHAEDRAKIAGVFSNRIRAGMKLQSDPTVIYGMGSRYQGNIRKKDLQADTPYNTYTRGGLPPTPIALPGHAAIEATLRPEKTDAIFFVAKGDGTGKSHFSDNLTEHNTAVSQYWQRRRENATTQ